MELSCRLTTTRPGGRRGVAVGGQFRGTRVGPSRGEGRQVEVLERPPVLTYRGLRTTPVLVDGVAFFTAVVLGTRIKLDILATDPFTAAKRLFGISNFRVYTLADGIRELCVRSPRRSQPGANTTPQLTLGFPEFLGKVLAAKGLTANTGECHPGRFEGIRNDRGVAGLAGQDRPGGRAGRNADRGGLLAGSCRLR